MKGYDFMEPYLATVFILMIIFFLICIECILRKKVSYIVKEYNENMDLIESHIREIIFLNPKSEIIVVCTPKSPETLTILNNLEKEYSQLHIIKM